MSHLRLLICRVDDADAADTAMTELARVDLPAVPGAIGSTLDTLETQVATIGQRVLGRLVELQWEEIDAQAVAEYRARYAPGSVVAHRDGRPHLMPGDDLLAAHTGLLITRGLAEQACLLPQDLPFATAARLLGWQIGEPTILSATTLRTLVRAHGARIRCLEQGEATYLLSTHTCGRRLRGVRGERPRRHPGWPAALSAAVEAALHERQRHPPEGVFRSDWDRVREAHAADPTATADALRRLGPEVAPGQMLLVLDEVLTRTQTQGQFHELRTACLLTSDGRRYLSGTGPFFLRQVQAAVQACCARSLLVVADGAGWIRAFFRDYLAAFPQAEMLLDWYHLVRQEVA